MGKFEGIMNAFAKFGICFYFLYARMLQKICGYLHTDSSTSMHIPK